MWWNGIHGGFRNHAHGRAGSNPVICTEDKAARCRPCLLNRGVFNDCGSCPLSSATSAVHSRRYINIGEQCRIDQLVESPSFELGCCGFEPYFCSQEDRTLVCQAILKIVTYKRVSSSNLLSSALDLIGSM